MKAMPTRCIVLAIAMLSLVLSPAVSAHASSRAADKTRVLSVRQALLVCSHAASTGYAEVYVQGYFRNGPITDGPTRLAGALFDLDTVPLDADLGLNFVQYHGLRFGISNVSPLGNHSRVLDQVRPHSHVVLHGSLRCAGSFSFLTLDQIRILRQRRMLP